MQTTYQTAAVHNNGRLLRSALRGNGVFSTLSGFLFLLMPTAVATFLGWPTYGWLLMLVGAVLLLYAGLLFWEARKPELNRGFAKTAVFMDLAWVIGSALILLLGTPALTIGGMWAVGLVADAVLVFAILQAIGLRRLA